MVSENGTGKLEIHFMISWRHLAYVGAAGLILTARSTKLSLSHKAKAPMLELREGGAARHPAVHSGVLSKTIK